MSPEQRAELELLVAAHTPSIAQGERERLLFESARQLGQQQAAQQAVRKSLAAAAVSCVLTLLMSWAAMPGWREELSPAKDAVHDARLVDQQLPGRQPTAESVMRNSAQRIAASHSGTSSANSSPFDQNVLTPVSWSARWELSHVGSLSAAKADLETADMATAADWDEPRRWDSAPLRAGTPIDHL